MVLIDPLVINVVNEHLAHIKYPGQPANPIKGAMMKRLLPFVKNAIKYLPMFVLIFFTLSACASRSYIKVNYQLPNKIPDKPAVTEIRLSVVDQRTNPDPLSITAREKLKNFHESYMLIMAPKGEDAPIEGIYDLKTLFELGRRRDPLPPGGGDARPVRAGGVGYGDRAGGW